MNKHGVSRRQFTETDVKHFKSGALKTITNTVVKEYILYDKLKKKEFPCKHISKVLLIDTEQFSKIQISSQVFFMDFVDWIRTTLKMDFFEGICQEFCCYISEYLPV